MRKKGLTILRPVAEREFDQLISRFGLFEEKPLVAVGVSGGADSLCLVLLLDVWLRRRGGRAVALVVDHQLRSAAKEEIQRLVGWLENYGIQYRVLTWQDDKPRKKSQAAAREARYQLLTGWCRRVGVLHLALAHHRDDQAETHILRKACGSGSDGLAAMPIVSEQNYVRLLRPLLSVPSVRLRATLRSMHQCWIEDPSNDDPAYARTHVRRELAKSSGEDTGPAHLASIASDYAGIRRESDEITALLLVRVVQFDPAGFCWVDPKLLTDAPTGIGLRALNQILLSIGGNKYGPRRESLLLLYEAFQNNRLKAGRTLSGCYIASSKGRVFICREPAAAGHVLCLRSGQRSLWDHRFHVFLGSLGAGDRGKFEVRRLGADGWRSTKQQISAVHEQSLPLFARYCLPALWDLEGLVAVPHLGYLRDTRRAREPDHFAANFRPRRAVAGPPFEGVDTLAAVKNNIQ